MVKVKLCLQRIQRKAKQSEYKIYSDHFSLSSRSVPSACNCSGRDRRPQPVVAHDVARALTLQRYAVVKKAL